MDRLQIEVALGAAESALDQNRSLEGTGFWKAVGAARKDPELAAEFGSRIAVLDRRAFEAAVKLRVPAPLGTALLTGGTAAGFIAVFGASNFDDQLVRSAVFLGGFALLEVSTHSLAHWVVGSLMGMKFTHYFLGGPPPPRPGTKIDYRSYLKVPPFQRAVMHASGAVVTKVIPFALVPVAANLDLSGLVVPLLLVVGVGQIATDVLLSTKTSDWKKVKRELRAASKLKGAK